MRLVIRLGLAFLAGYVVTALITGCKSQRHEWHGVPPGAACRRVAEGPIMCVKDGRAYTCIEGVNRETDTEIVIPIECAPISPMQPAEAP